MIFVPYLQADDGSAPRRLGARWIATPRAGPGRTKSPPAPDSAAPTPVTVTLEQSTQRSIAQKTRGAPQWGCRGVTRAGKPDFLLVYAVALIMICATLVTTFEQGYGSSLVSFPQALWWSLVTITTVGYGYSDEVPVSSVGRVVAVFLMLGGLGIFGAITANLASIFSHSEDPNTALIADLAEQVRELKAEISSRRP